MAEAIGKLLVPENKTLSVAESCTGGFVSHLITSVPGCSAWYKGAVTAYSNQVKTNVLGVRAETIEMFGAVSEETACEMAAGVRNLMGTDFAVATTGIAGPDGGSPEKPVGTVWIAVATAQKVSATKFVFGDNRERNILRSGQSALQLLRKIIIEKQ